MVRFATIFVGLLPLVAACGASPPACTEKTVECQFEHYKFAASLKPPAYFDLDEFARLPGAQDYVRSREAELPQYAYDDFLEATAEANVKAQ